MIVLERVGMVYQAESGPLEALRNISLRIEDGEFVSLLGPSGCGKSTLLRAVAGLRPTSSGSIFVNGLLVEGPIPQVGMVFQAANLLRWRSILDNVLLPAELSGLDRRKFRNRAHHLLEVVGLIDFASKRPNELSGGMQQRVALCRALLLDPPLLLMDEPFGALDAITRDEMNVELLRIWGEEADKRKTIIFVTHGVQEAAFLSDRVVVLSRRPGQTSLIKTIDLPRPRDAATRVSSELAHISLELQEALTHRATA